ncbi:MAG TPA: hypothetical protein PLE30_11085, partial [Candidatus Kapabacteria bacterium]|nr:hypothetical protein [Candidatus Kapabacteria bacterium]
AEIGLMGLTGVATDVALSSPFATKYLSTASNYIKGLLGFGDDAVKGGEKIIIHFGKAENQINHAFRHTDELGLDRSLVQSIVERHFKPLSTKVVTGEPFNRIIEIGGKRIQYTAFKLPDGTFNIGRIHGVK